MRYAIFSDIHANLEALEAVLAKIDEIAEKEPIDAIWFLGDLVGYGPDPNECIIKLRERTDVIIAGNHDWAAVGKIDLEDFSAAARISAEWTAEQLTEEHRAFLINLPERIVKGECTLVHGSPFGPLWEYLTSEVLAERSFQHFYTRYCFVGHTHVPVIFQQPLSFSEAPTMPLDDDQQAQGSADEQLDEDDEGGLQADGGELQRQRMEVVGLHEGPVQGAGGDGQAGGVHNDPGDEAAQLDGQRRDAVGLLQPQDGRNGLAARRALEGGEIVDLLPADLAVLSEQRATRVALVDRRIDLNELIIWACANVTADR